jgi:serine/threonine protein kinase
MWAREGRRDKRRADGVGCYRDHVVEEVSTQLGQVLRLGAYEIVRKLTRGGMAELFLARKTGSDQLFVLKKILPKYASSSRMVQLFQDEAKLAASLEHPNIVRVHDIEHAGKDHFFAMEYLHGQDVRTILHRAFRTGTRMPLHHAVAIARQVAAALHYAHDKRRTDDTLLDIVHRDVSPSNVIVTFDGGVKLVDFGVAKTTSSTIKTRTGTLKGKIAYMSPEQARGMPLDRRSDIFSLGIVLWEMVTTQRLFRGENDLATLQLVINQAPRKPSEVEPSCPSELEDIILRALAQDVTRRYQTAADFERDLADFAAERTLDHRPSTLAEYVSGLFAAELSSWHEAQAAGIALFEHLTQVAELTTPISESEFIEAVELDDEEPPEDDDEDDNASAAGSIISRSEPTKPARRDPSVPRVRPPAVPTPRGGAAKVPAVETIDAAAATAIGPPPIVEEGTPVGAPIATPSGGFAVQGTPSSTPGVRATITPTPYAAASDFLRDVALLQDMAADRAAANAPPDASAALIARYEWWFWRVGAGIVALIIVIGLVAGSW